MRGLVIPLLHAVPQDSVRPHLRLVPIAAVSLAFVLVASCGARTELEDNRLASSGRDAASNPDAHPGDAAPIDGAVPCSVGDFPLGVERPAVVFVLDNSGSMGDAFGANGESRWGVLTGALAATLPPVD